MSSVARQIVLVVLQLVAVVGLFVAAQSGQRRLEEAGRQVQSATQRELALADALQQVRSAESSQRGYILTDNANYLMPFQEASGNLPQAMARLEDAYATAPPALRAEVADVERLINEKFGEMRETLEAYRTRGRAAALEIMRTDYGMLTMRRIDERVRVIEKSVTDEVLAASASWQSRRWVGLAVTLAALAATIGLVLLLSRLAVRQLRSREREAAEAAQRHAELEQLVEQRTAELSELSTHLQSLAEQEKAALSRELHDELGGLLVAARMDVSWIEDRIGSHDPEVRAHFRRVHEALQSGVDVKRRVVENLRPSLLDNLGLFPALRSQVADACSRAGLKRIENYPEEEEARLTPEASIIVFRIVQEALTNIVKHARASTLEVSMELRAPWLVLRIRDDGVGLALERLRALRAHGLAAMRQRANGLGGQWQVRRPEGGGTEIEVRLPLERVLEDSVVEALGEAEPAASEASRFDPARSP